MRRKQNNLSLAPIILALLLSACGSQGLGGGQNAGVSQNASGSLDHLLTARGGRPDNGRRCEETTTEWQNFRLNKTATGTFSIRSRVTFSGDPASADALVAFSSDAGTTFNGYSMLLEVYEGVFKARDGDQYVGNIPVVPYVTYGVEIAGDLAQETYSVFINGDLLVTDASFRSDYTGGPTVGAWGLWQAPQSGWLTVCDLSITTDGNQPPVAKAGPDQTQEDSDGDGNEVVTLDGTGSYDPDGTIVSYQWFEGAQLLATGKTAQITLPLGLHSITLNVEDNDGAGATDALTVQIEPAGGGSGEDCPRPDEFNTGPRLSATLTMGSELNLTEARIQQLASQHPQNFFQESGKWVIYRVFVVGQIIFNSATPPVIIRDSTIDAGDGLPGSSQNCLSGGSGHLVEYTRLEGSTSPAFNGNGWTFKNSRFTETSQHGFQGGYYNTFIGNLFDHLGRYVNGEYPHVESGILFQGKEFTFECNYVDLPYPPPPGYANPTACINFQADDPNGNGHGMDKFNVNYNWFNGGGYTVYVNESGSAKITNFNLIGNRFSTNYQYGQWNSNLDWLNRDDLTVRDNIGWNPATGEEGGKVEFQQE